MYNFNWRMTEQDWNNLKKGTGNVCGSVLVGSMCIEFIYDEIPYVNTFVAGTGSYGVLDDGTPYDLIDDEININQLLTGRTFTAFKSLFKARFEDVCNVNPAWRKYAQQEGNWAWR